MNAVLDPAIKKDATLAGRVRWANRCLKARLGRFKDEAEARWAVPAGRAGPLELTLRLTADPSVEGSDTFSADVLQHEGYPGPRLRRVVNHLFSRRLEVHRSRVLQMIHELDREEALTGA